MRLNCSGSSVEVTRSKPVHRRREDRLASAEPSLGKNHPIFDELEETAEQRVPRFTASAAEALASATSWQASSECTPASMWRAALGRRSCILWWVMPGSGPKDV